jgi:cell division protease FtsH
MRKWWQRNQHWALRIVLFLVAVMVAAASAPVMRFVLMLMGLAFNVAAMASLMIVQVIFYFGFLMYYLGGTKTVKIMPGQAGEVTFDDYWGQPELLAVARQWVELLGQPQGLRRMGGQPVTGVLLSGPPGSGKTFLAKALAGEAAVPFLGLDGSRLISMWLGIGSVKIMRLYSAARRYARRYGACVVFIDEMDAIGANRGGLTGQGQSGMMGGMPLFGGGGVGVLNTLLTELDGINESRGWFKTRWYAFLGKKLPQPDYWVMTIGATNRPDVLDPALTRAGRLDVKIRVDPTDRQGRYEVIKGYMARVRCLEPIDIDGFAADTIGHTPADLMTLIVRRAPALALKEGREGITNRDLQAALAEHTMGLRQPIASILEEDKRAIAYHEAGHAVATWALTQDRITRASIVRYSGGPSGGASLGHIYPVPSKERVGAKVSDIAKKICVSLASRAAEIEFLGEPHMGGTGDMMNVRALMLMLAEEGLFSSLGYSLQPSPELVREMDAYGQQLMGYTRGILRQHAAKVEALVEALMKEEELDAAKMTAILGPRPNEQAPGHTGPPIAGTGDTTPLG